MKDFSISKRSQWSRVLPSSTTDFGEGEHDTPHLPLVAKTIFAHNLELGISSLGVSDRCCDISRDKLLPSGRQILTDAQIQRLGGN